MTVDLSLSEIYPSPYGGPTTAIDVHMQRSKFQEDFGRSVAALANAGADLAGYAGRRQIADPYWRGYVALIRDARVKAVTACDALLAALEEPS